jgi:hypothetical protein
LGDGHLSGCFSKWLALLQDHELRKIIFVLNKQIEPLNQHKPKS